MTVSVVVLAAALALTHHGGGTTLCVGGPHCFPTIQAAVDAAHDGDTIRIAPGAYAGGILVDRSIDLDGGGARATIISGGGPVLTIGDLAGSAPTVSISGVTITGGRTSTAQQCGPTCGTNYVSATALGGGVEVMPHAVVSIADSVVAGNAAAPVTTVPSVRATCPSGPCRFGTGGGGGIDSWGGLTLTNTLVTDNDAGGPLASDAYGGGILAEAGSVTLLHSTVSGNRARTSPPNGRFGEGGGIFVRRGVTLSMEHSSVSDNVAGLSSLLPFFLPGGGSIDMNANSGGIHVGDDSSVTIEDSSIDGNVVDVSDPNGEPYGFDAGMLVGASSLVLHDSSVSGNSVRVVAASSANVGPSGNALEFDGSAEIANARINGNSAAVTTTGDAAALGAIGAFAQDGAVIANSSVSGNTATATSAHGAATAYGGGIANDGALELRNDRVDRNVVTGNGTSGAARGGGIWNDELFFGPPQSLAISNSLVMGNAASGGAGITLAGGGIFTAFPVTLSNSAVTHNTPDDCAGC